MVANALIVTIALLLALGFWLLGELKFLIPYRHILFGQYGTDTLTDPAGVFDAQLALLVGVLNQH